MSQKFLGITSLQQTSTGHFPGLPPSQGEVLRNSNPTDVFSDRMFTLTRTFTRRERKKNTIEKSSNSQILHQIDTWINFEPSHTSPIAPIQPNPYPPSFPHPSSFPPPASPFPPHPHPSFNCHPLQPSKAKDHLPYPATSLPLSLARDPTRGFP